MEFSQRVKELTDRALENRKDLFLIDMSISLGRDIKLVIDGDKGVSIEDCIEISRAIEHNLDRENEDFSLEVTSYGISEPLILPRQFSKNIDRKLKVKVAEQKEIEGTLKSVSEDSITLETKTREPKPIGKGKITVVREHYIVLADIEKAKVVIKF